MPRSLAILAVLMALVLLPYYAGSNTTITIASQTLVWVVLALSYNIVLGQTGLLSFCHAVFFGAGAFAASHIIVAADGGSWSSWPVWLTPVLAFGVGAATAFLLGLFLAGRTGVAFVMITLAISQLVIYLAIAFDSIFGGEGGIGIDRAYDEFLFGLASFGPQREAYWLVLTWALITAGLIWLLRRTSFGMLAEATRENEERVRFSGQSTWHIRLIALVIAGGFAGLAGALHAINIEQVSTDQFSLKTSAFALFMCVIGGSRHFLGPVLGAIFLSVLDKVLPDYTSAWLLYLGLIFIVIVLYAPGGLAGIIDNLWTQYVYDPTNAKPRRDAFIAIGFALAGLGLIMVVEMATSLGAALGFNSGGAISIFGVTVDPKSTLPWAVAVAALASGAWILRRAKAEAEA